MTTQGYVPENIVIYSRGPDTWHLNPMYGSVWPTNNPPPDGTIESVKGRKGFPVDKEKDKGPAGTAGRWADAKPVPARSRMALLLDDVGEAFETVPNAPRKNLRVFNLEERGEGGRAYKVIDDEGYVWDMREDVFVEALMTQGIRPGGYIGGDFVFGIKGSQIKLVRVGSELHTQLDVSTTRRAQAEIPDTDLVVGTMYQNKAGKYAMFCGWVSIKGSKKKMGLWFQIKYGTTLDRDWLQQMYGYKLLDKHNYVSVVGPQVVPSNLVELMRTAWAREHVRQLQGEMDRQRRIGHRLGYRLGYPISDYAKKVNLGLLTMVPFGQTPRVPPEFAPYL